MKKVIVIGCPGAGKSTFSRALSERTGLPLYHLDMIYHRPDRTHIGREEFDCRLAEIMSGEKWLIDGNYQRTIETRLNACDTVFLLDFPLEVCLAGVRERIGKDRPDIPWKEDRLDPDFERFIRDFSAECLPVIYELFEKYPQKNIYIFKSREQAERCLLTI